jgi:Ca-activated chloride channel family protein
MHFTSPWNLLWMLPIGGLIVLMYILKLRRKDVVVSSTFLWRQVIRDVQANAPFQKLRKNLLLLLQLIIAALIIFALSRPFIRAFGRGGRTIVLVVDTSASMRATDVRPSRLDAARQKARELVASLGPGDKMMVLSAYSRPEALTGFTGKAAELRQAIDSLKPHDTPNSMRDALNLAADLIASHSNGEGGVIDLLSDGGFEAQVSTAGAPGAEPQYVLSNLNLGKTHLAFYPIGKDHDNVGITAIDFRRNLGNDRPTVQFLVVTHNYASQTKTFTEEIYRDDNLIDAHEVTLAPNGEDTEPYDLEEPAAPARMRVKLDLKDDLAVDNEVTLILKPRKVLKVLLAGPGNSFLENALRVDPGVELSKTEQAVTASGYDVTIFNEKAPARLPEGNYLFLHCTSDQTPAKVDGTADNVAVADWEHDHPVLRYVDFGSERFATALKASPAPWGRELAVGESGSLVVAGEKGKMRAEFVGFSLENQLFQMRVAFPIFIANSVRWLGTGSDDSELGAIHTGDPITLPAPSGLALTVTKPDGTKEDIRAGDQGEAVFAETSQAGIYTAAGKGYTYTFAANLANEGESDITPHRSLSILDNPTASAGHRVPNPYELLPLLALLALVVLMVEWWAFHRRVFVN